MTCFVDTSVWYAAADTRDLSNIKAKAMLQKQTRLVTSDYVVLETWRLLHHRISWAAAESFWQAARSGACDIEPITPADLDRASQIGQDYEDQQFSLTDRTSFALMQRLRLRQVATFDSDFAIFRHGKNNAEAFEMVR